MRNNGSKLLFRSSRDNTTTTVHQDQPKSPHINGDRRLLTPKPVTQSHIGCSLLVTLILFTCAPLQTEALQYDLWFKYPHPFTPAEPVNYCPKSVGPASKSSTCQASKLPVFINSVDSPKTFIPLSITQVLDFCPVSEVRILTDAMLTSWDDYITLSSFEIRWPQREECKLLCKKKYAMNSSEYASMVERLAYGLKRDYYHHWFADTLPFNWCYKFNVEQQHSPLRTIVKPTECTTSFPIGYVTDDRGLPVDERVPIGNFSKQNAMFLYNHFEFTIYYETGEGKSWSGRMGNKVGRVTYLRINPRSINHEANGPVAMPIGTTQMDSSACSTKLPPIEIPYNNYNTSMSIIYSYSVDFVIDDDPADGVWERRWHRLETLLPGMTRAKWIAALAILIFIASLVPAAYAVARTIFTDRVLIFVNPRDDSAQEAAWKTLAGDIFREPSHITVLSSLVGSGCQFVVITTIGELVTVFIFLPIALLLVVVLLIFLCCNFLGGYAGIRLYQTFGGERWVRVCCFISLLNPILITYPMAIARDQLLFQNGSELAKELLGTLAHLSALIFLFLLALLPTLAGGNMAFRQSSMKFPVRPTANERIMLEPLVWRKPAIMIAFYSLIIAICIWFSEAYPMVGNGGYFITVIGISIVVCLSISHCYLHLSQYDHRWWWRPYLVSGLAAIYYFIYCAYYVFNNLYVDSFVSAILYLAIQLLTCICFFMLIGTIGFAATFLFLWHTYSRTNPSPDMNYAMFQKDDQVE